MMARVSLGHTGRAMRIGSAMAVAFVLAQLAGVSRVLLPILLPAAYLESVLGSASGYR